MHFSYHNLLIQISNMKDNYYIHIFIISIIIDILTGFFKNIVNNNHSLNSSIGSKGLIKHIIILFIVITIYPYLSVLGFSTYANYIIVFYIVNYVMSIIENLSEMGIKVPYLIENKFEKIYKKYNSKNNN